MENKFDNVEEVEVEETVDAELEKKEELKGKVIGGLKTVGKVVLVGSIGFVLGKLAGQECEDEDEEEFDYEDYDDEESEVSEEDAE